MTQDPTSTPQAAVAAAMERVTDSALSPELLAAFPIFHEGEYGAILALSLKDTDGRTRGAVLEFRPNLGAVTPDGDASWTDIPADAVPLAIERSGWSGVRS